MISFQNIVKRSNFKENMFSELKVQEYNVIIKQENEGQRNNQLT